MQKCEFYRCGVLDCCELGLNNEDVGTKKYSINCSKNDNCLFKQNLQKQNLIDRQDKTIEDLIGCISLWEDFSGEECILAEKSSIADLILLLRKEKETSKKLERKISQVLALNGELNCEK